MITNKKVIAHFESIQSSLEDQWKQRLSKKDPFTHVWIVRSDSEIEKIPDDFIRMMFASDNGKEDFSEIIKAYVTDNHPQGIIFCMEAWVAKDINEDLLPRSYHTAKNKAEAISRCTADAGGARSFGSLYGRAVEIICLTVEDDEGGSFSVMYDIQKDGSLVIDNAFKDVGFKTYGKFANLFNPEKS